MSKKQKNEFDNLNNNYQIVVRKVINGDKLTIGEGLMWLYLQTSLNHLPKINHPDLNIR